MSFEAIQQVTSAEQAAQARKAAAQEEALRIVAEAERGGKQLVADACAKAEAKAKQMMAQAEARAAETSKKTMADNAASCAAMKQQAMGRLDRAADLIVGKVGSG